MTISRILKNHLTSTIPTLIITLLISACSTEENLSMAATDAEPLTNTDISTNTTTNIAALISGVDSGSVTEDVDPDGDNLLEVGGRLNITDSDAGEAAFSAKVINGNYGYLTMTANGYWYYAANNNQAVVQNLNTGATLTDRLTISSVDGTAHTVVITIVGVIDSGTIIVPGTNNPAIITGVDSGSVTEDVDPDSDNLLEVGGRLNITDSDAGEAAFSAKVINGNYGNLTMIANGYWNYAANNNQAAVQNLNTGATLTDRLTISSVDGTTHTVRITINGANEANNAAVITGTDSGSVTEDVDPDGDNLLEVGGRLNITDSDAGEAAFSAKVINGNYGYLTMTANGYWYYAANNNQAVVQNLNTGATLTDRLTISSVDGTTHTVRITINGANEANNAAVITGTDSGSVTEDVDPDGDNLLEVGGKLNITDSDAGEAAFTAKVISGNYGNLTMLANGYWNYAASNNQAAVQNLNTGATLTDRLTISSVDGTTHTVRITINGANEAGNAAVITGTDSGSVTEDVDPDGDNLLEVGGKLNITDSDAGEAAFTAKVISGNYGNLTMLASGFWNYAASNNQAAVQNLNTGATLTDRLTISSVDGTTHTVRITINGANEAGNAAVITGTDSGSVTEDVDPDGDNLLEVGGKLNITDSDAGEAAFTAKVINGNYGNLTINTTGNWNYAANNNQAVVQNLNTGATLTDRLTISSVDGTTHTMVITINGANENSTLATINLSWVAPAERENNSAISLSEISGYKISYGTTQGQYPNSVTINDGTAVGHTFTDFPAGTYYFVVTTLDTEGRESQYSTEVIIII